MLVTMFKYCDEHLRKSNDTYHYCLMEGAMKAFKGKGKYKEGKV
jgi:hypothetical protein